VLLLGCCCLMHPLQQWHDALCIVWWLQLSLVTLKLLVDGKRSWFTGVYHLWEFKILIKRSQKRCKSVSLSCPAQQLINKLKTKKWICRLNSWTQISWKQWEPRFPIDFPTAGLFSNVYWWHMWHLLVNYFIKLNTTAFPADWTSCLLLIYYYYCALFTFLLCYLFQKMLF